MKLDGTYTFNAPREVVWATLQDPDALRACMPGVEQFEQTGPDDYRAVMRIGVGNIKGSYTSAIRVFDRREPEHYKLAVEARGTPGFVRGEATCDLSADASDRTTLTWSADGQVGGTIAAVGQRLLGGVARMTITQLFKAMDQQVQERRPPM